MTRIGVRRTAPKRGLKKTLPSLYELDALFSQKIRAKGVCEYCGQVLPKEKLECHHFIPRVYGQTRFEPDNACSVDKICHVRLQNNVGNCNEILFKRLRGWRRVDALNKIARTYQKLDREQVMERLKCL